MNVPKWLIPVISIVAALAVGIAAVLIGIQFAASVVAEHPAIPEVAPVIAPIAVGLTDEQTQSLIDSGDAPGSSIVGSRLVTPPSDLPASGTDAAIFHEITVSGSGAAADESNGADSLAGTPEPTADDPCSTTDGSTPDGCPDGLHSAIFALTGAPALAVTIHPFTAPCGTEPVPLNAAGTRVNVPVLISPTAPATLDIAVRPDSGIDGQQWIDAVPTDPALVASWEDARAADTPVESLPGLGTCVILPNLPAGSVYYVDVTAHRAGSDNATATVGLNTVGAPTPQGLQISTYGGNGFLAYVDHPVTEQVGIRAYTGVGAGTARCDDTRGLTDLSNVTGEDVRHFAREGLESNNPAGYDYRYALGYIVPAGTTVLVCAKWYNPGTSPSWEQITPLRTDSAVVESPDAILPVISAQAINGYSYPGAASVVVSAETVEGSGCGLRNVTLYRGPDFEPDGRWAILCAVQGAGAETASGLADSWFLREAGFSGDIAVHTTVNGEDGTTRNETRVLPTSVHRPIFCNEAALNCGTDSYLIEIPGYPHSETDDGLYAIKVTWVAAGNSGLSSWRVTPAAFDVPEQPGDPSAAAPLLDTFERIRPVLDGVSNGVAADMILRVNTPADYEIHLTGLHGDAPCALGRPVEPLTASGHVDDLTGIHIQGLCYGEQYWASITLTNAHGTTVWGYDNPGSGWLANLMTTPRLTVEVEYTATLAVPAGQAVTDFDLQIDRQELDPTHRLASGCVATPITNTGTTTMQLGSKARLRIQYQLHPRASGSGCSVAPGDTTPMGDVYLTLPLADILANPDGYHVATGPVDLIVKITPSP
jgi:hypothetical protein